MLSTKHCDGCGQPFHKTPRKDSPFCSLACRRRPIEERFWEKVDKTDGCWLWTGATMRGGYGHIDRNLKTHRLAWQWATGETLTSREHILHTCDTPACVRNDDRGVYVVAGRTYLRIGHLFKANSPTNTEDMIAKHRNRWNNPVGKNAGESHGMAKLTADQVREIRRLHATGVTGVALARQFSVHQSAVSLIVNRRAWSHL